MSVLANRITIVGPAPKAFASRSLDADSAFSRIPVVHLNFDVFRCIRSTALYAQAVVMAPFQ